MKKVTNAVRFKWFDMGIELDIDLDKLKVSVNLTVYNNIMLHHSQTNASIVVSEDVYFYCTGYQKQEPLCG